MGFSPAYPYIMGFKILIFIIGFIIVIAVVSNLVSSISFKSIIREMDKFWNVLSTATGDASAILTLGMDFPKNNILFQAYGSGQCKDQLEYASSVKRSLDNFGALCEGDYCVCIMSWESDDNNYFFNSELMNAPSWWDYGNPECSASLVEDDGKGNVESCSDVITKTDCFDSKQKSGDNHKHCYWEVSTGDVHQKATNNIHFTSIFNPTSGKVADSCAKLLTNDFIRDSLTTIHCRSLGKVENPEGVFEISAHMEKPTLDDDPQSEEDTAFLWAISDIGLIARDVTASPVTEEDSGLHSGRIKIYFRFGDY